MKQKIFLALLAIMLSVPAKPESKVVHYGKKTAKITWHLAEIGSGAMATYGLYNVFCNWYNDGYRETFEDKRGVVESPWFISLLLSSIAVAAPSLIGHGLYGLNKEGEIVDRIKRLYKNKIATTGRK